MSLSMNPFKQSQFCSENIEDFQINQQKNIYEFSTKSQMDLQELNDNTNYNLFELNLKQQRKCLQNKIKQLFPFLHISNEQNLPLIQIDLKSSDLKEKLKTKLKNHCVQIMNIEQTGQNQTKIKFKLTDNQIKNKIQQSFIELKQQILIPPTPFIIEQNIIFGVVKINLKYCYEHQQIIMQRKKNLKKYLKKNQNKVVLPSIIACSKTFIIIDGHHRLSIYKQKKIKQVPVLLVNYDHQHILTHPQTFIPKQQIISRGYQKKIYSPKSTKHMIITQNGQLRPLVQISCAIDQRTKSALNQNFYLYNQKLQLFKQNCKNQSSTDLQSSAQKILIESFKKIIQNTKDNQNKKNQNSQRVHQNTQNDFEEIAKRCNMELIVEE